MDIIYSSNEQPLIFSHKIFFIGKKIAFFFHANFSFVDTLKGGIKGP